MIICPICKIRIRSFAGNDHDKLWNMHMDSGECQKYAEYAESQQAGQIKKCQYSSCKEKLTSTNRIQCSSCFMETCLKHKVPESHEC